MKAELSLPPRDELFQAIDEANRIPDTKDLISWGEGMRELLGNHPVIDSGIILEISEIAKICATVLPRLGLSGIEAIGNLGAQQGTSCLTWFLIGWRVHQEFVRRRELAELEKLGGES